MHKALGLYLIAFSILGVSAWQTSMGWLAPVGLAILFFGSLLLWRAEGHQFQELGYRRVSHWAGYLIGGFIVGAVIPLIVVLLMWAVGWADISFQIQTNSLIATGIIIALLRAGLITFAEELIFRGYFYRIFDFRNGNRIAVVLSSVLWALTHLPDMVSSGLSIISILIGMATFILWGIFLALVVGLGKDSLWIPFGVHFGYNFVFSMIGYFLVTNLIASDLIIGHPAWLPESGLLGMLIWGAALLVSLGISTSRKSPENQIAN